MRRPMLTAKDREYRKIDKFLQKYLYVEPDEWYRVVQTLQKKTTLDDAMLGALLDIAEKRRADQGLASPRTRRG